MALSYLLDTDVCVVLLNGADRSILERLTALPGAQVAMCSVVRGELESGAWRTADPYGRIAKLEKIFDYRSLVYDDAAAASYGRITADLRKAGREIGTADTMIAAIALANDLAVITRNAKHYRRVKGLKVIRW